MKKRVREESIHPIGHMRIRKVMFGQRGYMKYTQGKRIAQRNMKVVTVGTTGFPIPRRAPPKTSFIPQIK